MIMLAMLRLRNDGYGVTIAGELDANLTAAE